MRRFLAGVVVGVVGSFLVSRLVVLYVEFET